MDNTFRTMLAGMSGQGKSYYFKNTILPNLIKRKEPIIIFDRTGEYGVNERDMPKIKKEVFEGFSPFHKRLSKTKKLKGGTVYIITCKEDADYFSGLTFLNKLASKLTIILDEAHDIFLSQDLKFAKTPLVRLVRYGRQNGISVLMITQRYLDLPPDIRSQFYGLISFKQTEPADCKELGKKFQDGDKITTLKEREFLSFGDVPKVLT